jgi:hypothetical protein
MTLSMLLVDDNLHLFRVLDPDVILLISGRPDRRD